MSDSNTARDPIRVMHQRTISLILLIAICFVGITLATSIGAWRFPGNEEGYSPEQPINYSHRLHAGDLKIHCQFCHSAAGKSRYAGIPSSNVCMKCHSVVTDSYDNLLAAKKDKKKGQAPPISEELKKLYQALDLNESLKPKTDAQPKSIAWVKVHNLPDFVYFDHRAHVTAGVNCQRCHGPIESMQRVRQVESLSMGWCVNCHREVNDTGVQGKAVHASTNCAVCHF